MNEAEKLLNRALYVINNIPNQRNVGPKGESSYDMASQIDKYFTERNFKKKAM